MPRLAKKRLAQPPPSKAAQSIGAYARVCKSSALQDPAAGKDLVAPVDAASSRKRKAVSVEVQIPGRTISFAPSSDEDEPAPAQPKRACRRPDPRSPSAPSAEKTRRGKRAAKEQQARTRYARQISQSTPVAQPRRQAEARDDITPQSTICAGNKDGAADEPLPQHLADLVLLNQAFLKIVMLRMAHAGSNVPIDIGTITPNLSRTWGKRQVTVEDIRRCVAIQAHSNKHHASSAFVVSEYGRGKVCIEMAPGHHCSSLNEERLSRQFRENLSAICAERALDNMEDVGVTLQGLSLEDLPTAAITDMGAAAKANPVLRKGRQALSELISDRDAKQQDKEARKQAAFDKPMLNADGTKMSLLDRLRVKQLAKANEPPGPTGPELQRRAALNRVVDVAATISMLSLSNPLSLPRQAFTMLAISEKLQDSLRVPLSKEEGMACVRLIASEVAPGWLRVVTIGGRENVVVQRNGQPVDRVIRERVQKLLA